MDRCTTIDGEINIYNKPLKVCGCTPVTGFTREGSCILKDPDYGMHTVCSVVTSEFLTYSFSQGNDLITPRPEYDFPGLKPGDHWCLCAKKWLDAYEMGVAPLVILEATNKRSLSIIPIDYLEDRAYKE